MRPPPAHAFVNRLVALTVTLFMFAGSLGLGAVWFRQEISQTANRSRALEGKIADVERRLDEVSALVATATNPEELVRQNEAMRLGLAAPREVQVVRVAESPELRLAAKRSAEAFRVSATSAARNDLSFRVVTASLR